MHTFKNFVQFEMNHIVKNEGPSEKCRWYIDGYTEDENEEGSVIATVVLTEHNDIITNWHRNRYRLNETVLNLIKKAKELAKTMIEEEQRKDNK